MLVRRRDFLIQSTAAVTLANLATAESSAETPIIDTHQHLWDLSRQKLPWLGGAPEVLKHSYRNAEYREATRGLNVKAVYMEVDVAVEQLEQEADHVVGLCREGSHPTIAAVIGGRPAADNFAEYVKKYQATGFVKGVRQVLHVPETPAGFCLQDNFVRGARLLGKHGMSLDLCMRPTELADGAKLAELCPDTRFILDHCGNADPKAFRKQPAGSEAPWHTVDVWKAGIERLAKRSNVIAKISGIVARAPKGWQTDDLAPAVNFCLDAFGPDRVIFGGDWPVCLLGSSLRGWIDALQAIVATRPATDRRKLWSENAIRLYGLKING